MRMIIDKDPNKKPNCDICHDDMSTFCTWCDKYEPEFYEELVKEEDEE